MTIYVDNGDTVKIYPTKAKVAKAIETLLELDHNSVWSETDQPKTGHWKHNKCDVCGASRPPLFDNFCPNCGAKMIEPKERSCEG